MPLPLALLIALCVTWGAADRILAAPAHGVTRPNVVLVMTDDQGYGDLGCTGNPVVQTPHLDRLAAESSQLTDYHVAPTCSPTRAALLTGHWSNRTGVWHTVNGRSMLRENEVTLAEMLADAGYATGLFGKWHLGDNFPYRAEDRGFAEVYRHGGGGVGQTPDAWNNAYFDGHYFHNGQLVAADGFCTDVFFRQAQRFIRQQAEAGRPFFAYIAPNAPHGPLHCPQEYLDRYPNQSAAVAAFYGMITNIDDNVGATRKLLDELGIADNTIFIFTTDNGTASGASIYNAAMRGAKGSEYDGGHRVPFFCHWPAGGINQMHTSDTLTHAVDIVPTLLEMTGTPVPADVKLDGISIRTLLDPAAEEDLPERMVVTDSQRVRDPIKWRKTAVMEDKWRLIGGDQLYDIRTDPGQKNNIAADHPQQVARMRAFYDAWWNELQPTFAQTTEIYLGHPNHPEVSLTGHDWIQEELPPWNQQHIRQGYPLNPQQQEHASAEPQSPRMHPGYWAVKVVEAGNYEISLRRWPVEADHPIRASLPAEPGVPGATRAFRSFAGTSVPIVEAQLQSNGVEIESHSVSHADTSVTFTTSLAAGSHRLAPIFVTSSGDELGAYYAIVRKIR